MGRKKERYNENVMHEMNVFAQGYLGWRHPLFNIKVFFKNIKRAWHRATKGYCDIDCYNLNFFYLELMIGSLEHFRTNLRSLPASLDEKEWDDILKDIISNLKNGREGALPNEWEGEKKRLREELSKAYTHNVTCEKGDEIYVTPLYDEYGELVEKWWEQESKNRAAEEENVRKALAIMAKWWHDLWD